MDRRFLWVPSLVDRTLDDRRAWAAIFCCFLCAPGLGCADEPPAAAERDAGSRDGGAASMIDSGSDGSDAAAPMSDAGPPDPGLVCPAVDCVSVAITTTAGRSVALDECAFGLRLEAPLAEGEALADALLDRLTGEGLGSRRTLEQMLGNLNRTGRSGITSSASARLSGLGARGFRWNTGDDGVDYWYPQGISGSADAGRDGPPLLLVSWYNKTEATLTKGVRLSLVDVSDLSTPRYRHVLLVDPYEAAGAPNFGPAEYDGGGALHAGGITWIGDRVYVADTSRGLRIYDLSRAFAPNHTDDTERVGIASGRSDAHGYAYAVPLIGRYVRASGTCTTRFSFVARGEVGGAPALITGAYDADTPNGQLVAWPLDIHTGLLAGGDVTFSIAAAVGGQTRVQGGLHAGDAWYLSSSSQDGSNGRLYVARPGRATTSVPWIYGCEDLYLDASDRLWTAGEHPGDRDVVSIPRP
jgi:hypothetical protein